MHIEYSVVGFVPFEDAPQGERLLKSNRAIAYSASSRVEGSVLKLAL